MTMLDHIKAKLTKPPTKILRSLDSSGDTVIEFTDELDAKAGKEAAALFERLTKAGHTAFTFPEKGATGEGKRIDSIKDAQAETIIIPRVVGG